MYGMKVERGQEPDTFTITTEDGQVICSNETRYWAKVIFRTFFLRGMREKLNAEFDRMADEIESSERK